MTPDPIGDAIAARITPAMIDRAIRKAAADVGMSRERFIDALAAAARRPRAAPAPAPVPAAGATFAAMRIELGAR